MITLHIKYWTLDLPEEFQLSYSTVLLYRPPANSQKFLDSLAKRASEKGVNARYEFTTKEEYFASRESHKVKE